MHATNASTQGPFLPATPGAADIPRIIIRGNNPPWYHDMRLSAVGGQEPRPCTQTCGPYLVPGGDVLGPAAAAAFSVGLYCGLVGEYCGLVGLYCGLVGLRSSSNTRNSQAGDARAGQLHTQTG
jgi:hypothetical protein